MTTDCQIHAMTYTVSRVIHSQHEWKLHFKQISHIYVDIVVSQAFNFYFMKYHWQWLSHLYINLIRMMINTHQKFVTVHWTQLCVSIWRQTNTMQICVDRAQICLITVSSLQEHNRIIERKASQLTLKTILCHPTRCHLTSASFVQTMLTVKQHRISSHQHCNYS